MATSFANKNTATLTATCSQRIAALKADVPATTQIAINGTTVPVADVIATYQHYLERQAAVTAKRAELKALVAARDAAVTKCQATDQPLAAWVVNQFGVTSQQAHDFGFGPRKTPVVSAETRALAVQKAAATRKARGTIGKKRRLAIKGVLPGQNGTSAPAAAAPPPTVNIVGTHAA